MPFTILTPPPTLGENNRVSLAGLLGPTDAAIKRLAREQEQLVKERKRAAG